MQPRQTSEPNLMISALMPAVRTAFSAASILAPTFAADVAFRLFSTPGIAGGLSPEQKTLAEHAKQRLADSELVRLTHAAGEIQTYRFRAHSLNACRGTVVIVHGWTSAALYMLAFVDPLLALGFDVVCFDLPAHGSSTGRTTDLRQCARALQRVAATIPDVYGIVAHSFGGPVTALALVDDDSSHLDIHKIALLAAPNAAADVIRSFGGSLGLHRQAQNQLETEFETLCACPLSEFTGSKFFSRINCPLLVLHGRDDHDVPYRHGLAYKALPNCRFVPLNSTGHRDILSSAQAVRLVSEFMALPDR
jgi:pimeloyl-ACP methyl ester carboxylesterase